MRASAGVLVMTHSSLYRAYRNVDNKYDGCTYSGLIRIWFGIASRNFKPDMNTIGILSDNKKQFT